MSSQDAVRLGRNMYDQWSRYWPGIERHPFAEFINSVKKYVVTSLDSSSQPQPRGLELRNATPTPGGGVWLTYRLA